MPRLPAPLPHRARQERRVPGARQPRRHALRHHLRHGLQRRRGPHREEAALPLLPRHDGALARQRGLQLRLPPLPELADRPCRPGRGDHATCASCPCATCRCSPTTTTARAWPGPTTSRPSGSSTSSTAPRLAHEHGLYTVMVTNGYITEEALDVLAPHIDAYRVDVKGFSDAQYAELCRIPDAGAGARAARARAKTRARLPRGDRHQRHPHVQRRRGDAARHRRVDRRRARPRDSLARHALHAAPRVRAPAADAHPHARETRSPSDATPGLRFVYVGNVPGHEGENTMCPNCKRLLVRRTGYAVEDVALRGTFCSMCGQNVNVRTSHQEVSAEQREPRVWLPEQ